MQTVLNKHLTCHFVQPPVFGPGCLALADSSTSSTEFCGLGDSQCAEPLASMQILKMMTNVKVNSTVYQGMLRFTVPPIMAFVQGEVFHHEGGITAIIEVRLPVPTVRWVPDPAQPLHFHEIPAHEIICYSYEKLVRLPAGLGIYLLCERLATSIVP